MRVGVLAQVKEEAAQRPGDTEPGRPPASRRPRPPMATAGLAQRKRAPQGPLLVRVAEEYSRAAYLATTRAISSTLLE